MPIVWNLKTNKQTIEKKKKVLFFCEFGRCMRSFLGCTLISALFSKHVKKDSEPFQQTCEKYSDPICQTCKKAYL